MPCFKGALCICWGIVSSNACDISTGAQQQVAGNASALSGLAFTSLADDDDMAQWVPNDDMAITPGSVAGAPQSHIEDSISLDTAFDVSPQY